MFLFLKILKILIFCTSISPSLFVFFFFCLPLYFSLSLSLSLSLSISISFSLSLYLSRLSLSPKSLFARIDETYKRAQQERTRGRRHVFPGVVLRNVIQFRSADEIEKPKFQQRSFETRSRRPEARVGPGRFVNLSEQSRNDFTTKKKKEANRRNTLEQRNESSNEKP